MLRAIADGTWQVVDEPLLSGIHLVRLGTTWGVFPYAPAPLSNTGYSSPDSALAALRAAVRRD